VIQHKIVLSGPVGAGKSTAVRALSEGSALATDVTASSVPDGVKDLTTVALDHGTFNLDNGDRVYLFGTPGQDRFDYMWEILAEGATGLVLLTSNRSADPLSDLRSFLRAFAPLIDPVSTVVGVTHTDLSPRPSMEDYRRTLVELGLSGEQVWAVDARRSEDIRGLVMALVAPGRKRSGRHVRDSTPI
jgi:signal recognition particle receptor subunit beta